MQTMTSSSTSSTSSSMSSALASSGIALTSPILAASSASVPSLDQKALFRAAWRADPTDAAYLPFLKFSDRATYLAWVADWKAQYADLVTRIRQAKTTRRDAAQPDDTRSIAQSTRMSLRPEAYTFLMLRKASKVQAGLQRAQSISAQA